MTDIMFDTNAYDEILKGTITLKKLEKSIELGFRYFITNIQIDELSNIPDARIEKRKSLVLFLVTLKQSVIPIESFVFGYARFGLVKLGNGEVYNKLLNESKNNVKDAIIGETAFLNNCILITEDIEFKNKIILLGGKSLSVKELDTMITKKL